MAVPTLLQLVQRLRESSELGVRRQLQDPFEQFLDLVLFFQPGRAHRHGGQLVGVRNLVQDLVVWRVLFDDVR